MLLGNYCRKCYKRGECDLHPFLSSSRYKNRSSFKYYFNQLLMVTDDGALRNVVAQKTIEFIIIQKRAKV